MKTKIPRINKTKDEIEQKMKNVEMVKAMRVFVRDEFYPALIKASTSIEDAKFLLGSFSNMVMEQFLSQMKEKQFIELKLHEKLDKASPNYKEYVDLLSLFGDKNVYDTRELIEGMKNEVEVMITNEMKERKLDTLKTIFYE
jgi:hypothetical protein